MILAVGTQGPILRHVAMTRGAMNIKSKRQISVEMFFDLALSAGGGGGGGREPSPKPSQICY